MERREAKICMSSAAPGDRDHGDRNHDGITMNSHPLIELAHVNRDFGHVKAVRDMSFEVRRGHVFGFIGPNGAGKTTSMRILATLDLPTSGDAFVDGFSVTQD